MKIKAVPAEFQIMLKMILGVFAIDVQNEYTALTFNVGPSPSKMPTMLS